MEKKNKKPNDIFQKIQHVIRNKEKIFYLNTFILAVLFLVVNFFIGSVLNIIKFDEYAGRSIQIKAEFIDSVSMDKIKEIEKDLLNDNRVNYIKYIPKEIAFKNLEDALEMELGSDNPLSNSMLIYLRNINEIEEIERIEQELTNRDEVYEVILKKEYIVKILSFKRNLKRIIRAISLFLIIPIVLLFYFIFGLNFSYLEEELRSQLQNANEGHKLSNILPYFITKLFTLLAAWIIALIMFIPFYQELVWQIYEINPFITLASIKEMYSPLLISLLSAFVLLITAGTFFRNPLRVKESKEKDKKA